MPEKTYRLDVTFEELRIIAAALNELPHKLVANLIPKLEAQVRAQEGENTLVPVPIHPSGEEVSQ